MAQTHKTPQIMHIQVAEMPHYPGKPRERHTDPVCVQEAVIFIG